MGLALLLMAGSAFGETTVLVDGTTSETGEGPFVEIVVYDGMTLPATVIAGCSDPFCMGNSGAPVTGTVTHVKNYIGWSLAGSLQERGVIYLYVDGEKATKTRMGRLLVWSTRRLSAGPHTLEAMTHDTFGVEGWSAPLSITVVK